MWKNADFNLFHSWSLKPEVKAVVAQAAYLLMVSIVAHADNWDLTVLYQLYQFLHGTLIKLRVMQHLKLQQIFNTGWPRKNVMNFNTQQNKD